MACVRRDVVKMSTTHFSVVIFGRQVFNIPSQSIKLAGTSPQRIQKLSPRVSSSATYMAATDLPALVDTVRALGTLHVAGHSPIFRGRTLWHDWDQRPGGRGADREGQATHGLLGAANVIQEIKLQHTYAPQLSTKRITLNRIHFS